VIATDGSNELVAVTVIAAQPSGALLGTLEDGRRVLAGPIDPCGQCEICRRGGAAVCPHAKRPEAVPSARVLRSARWLVPLGDGLDLPAPAAAAVGGDITCAYTLYARTGLGPREPVVITGATAVTRFLVEILRAKAITPVVFGEGEWAAWLASKGASVVAGSAEVATAITAQGLGARPLRVIATAPRTLETAASIAGPRATLTILADGELSALPGGLAAREVTVIGVAGPHPDLIVEAAAMCAKGEIELARGVTTEDGDPTRARVLV
jgi:D-arabinose 1-dehydrogenase-like Zn-dependent alcohol dehydrogenase